MKKFLIICVLSGFITGNGRASEIFEKAMKNALEANREQIRKSETTQRSAIEIEQNREMDKLIKDRNNELQKQKLTTNAIQEKISSNEALLEGEFSQSHKKISEDMEKERKIIDAKQKISNNLVIVENGIEKIIPYTSIPNMKNPKKDFPLDGPFSVVLETNNYSTGNDDGMVYLYKDDLYTTPAENYLRANTDGTFSFILKKGIYRPFQKWSQRDELRFYIKKGANQESDLF